MAVALKKRPFLAQNSCFFTFTAKKVKGVARCRDVDPMGRLGMPMNYIFDLMKNVTHIDANLLGLFSHGTPFRALVWAPPSININPAP